jgi:phosphoribosylamine-glycine ligase
MNIFILGSGGREHALAWKIAASPLTERLYLEFTRRIALQLQSVAKDILCDVSRMALLSHIPYRRPLRKSR